MGSKTEARGWSVFDGVKPVRFPPPSPEALMAEIDAAIAASEYARSTSALSCSSSSAAAATEGNETSSSLPALEELDIELPEIDAASGVYDKRIADEAYKAACGALAAGRPDSAIRSLHVAIASCPPDKTSALNKLRSLLAIASSQHLKQQQQQQQQQQL